MKQRPRIYYSESQKSLMWERWKQGATLHQIASRQRRGKTTTLLASVGSGANWVNDWMPIRDALKKKGSKYGELDRLLLVAVNADSFNLDTHG